MPDHLTAPSTAGVFHMPAAPEIPVQHVYPGNRPGRLTNDSWDSLALTGWPLESAYVAS